MPTVNFTKKWFDPATGKVYFPGNPETITDAQADTVLDRGYAELIPDSEPVLEPKKKDDPEPTPEHEPVEENDAV